MPQPPVSTPVFVKQLTVDTRTLRRPVRKMAGKRELPVDEVYRLVFHGIDYMIALSVEKGTSILNIEVEHEGSTAR